MRSSFLGLEMSKRTIQISQKALDVSTSNAANVMTPGFSRQRIDVHSMYMSSYKNWQTRQSRMKIAGQGVGAFGVSQIRNFYLDKRFREMNSHLAQNERLAPVLEEVQTTLDNFENVGMEGKLSQFKEALLRYATNSPDTNELAGIVRESALQIVDMFKTYSRDLNRLLQDNVFELRETVNYVNTIIEKITNLNVAIVKEYKATEFGAIHNGRGVSPYGPLELMDERNRLLDELSTYINIRVDENNDGSINVRIGDLLMIEGERNDVLIMRDYDSFGAAMIYSSNGQSLNIRSGELRAYIDLVNGNGPYSNHHQSSFHGIPYYISAIDAFAEAFATLMNEANGVTVLDSHRAMFGSSLDVYDEQGNLISRGPITAANIRISEEWMRDETMIGRINTGEPRNFYTYSIPPSLMGVHTFTITINGEEYDVDFDFDDPIVPPATLTGNLQAAINAEFATGTLTAADSVRVTLDPDGNILFRAHLDTNTLTVESTTTAVEEHRNHIPGGWAFSTNLDGHNAHKLMLALDTQEMSFGRALDFRGTMFDYVAFLSNRLGQGLNFIDEQIDTMTVTTNNLLDSRDAVMGVSTDEEGINMLIYTKWYNAAARLMTAMDELLDRVINGMGRVGL